MELARQLIAENKRLKAEGNDEAAKFLDLGNCGLTNLPDELFELEWLEELNLGPYYFDKNHKHIQSKNRTNRNQLKSNILFWQKSNLFKLTFLQKLTFLYLHDNQIHDISFLKELPNIHTLNLRSNRISDISILKNLKNIHTLDLMSNQISDISFLKNLKNIHTLNLSNNRIYDVSILEDLKNIYTLNLSNNQISNIFSLKNLKNIHTLDLMSNQISDISFLKNLKNIHTLDLSGNQIKDLSPLLFLIKKDIPVKWGWLGSNAICIKDNPLTNPPIEIIKEGNEAILNYFKETQNQETIQLYEAKMLIIGEPGAGKTTLARKLMNHNAAMPKEKESTKGIDIHYLDFEMADGNVFRVNIWDFGGQEIYHSTHQFFLTKRSLYALVTDNRSENTDFDYWLETVEFLGGASPVLIIQNEKAGRKKQLPLQSMKGRYIHLKESYSTDLKVNRDLDRIAKAVRYYIQQLPHIGETLPIQWLAIRRALEALAKEGTPYLSLEEYFDVCADHQIPEPERALFLSQYLHDLGAFLHFQDDDLLERLVILKNDWATEAVYKVLDCDFVEVQKGIFTRTDLRKIWKETTYRKMLPELLALMEKFELSYRLMDVKSPKYLVPQLLPIEQPTYSWNSQNNLVLIYRYGFMPKGLLSRLMVRLHRYILKNSPQWRKGMILTRNETKARVIEDYKSRNIEIKVKGTTAKELLTVVAEELDRLHATFENIQVEKMIPCNCRECKTAETPYFYPKKHLDKARQKGKQSIECRETFDDVRIDGLMDDLFVSRTNQQKSWVQQISKNKIRAVLEEMQNVFSDKDKLTTSVQLLSRLSKVELDNRNGVVNHDHFQLERNKVSFATLELVYQT